MALEMPLLTAALAVYLLLAALAVVAALRGRAPYALLASGLFAALSLHGAAILLRWARLGHGPYVDLFEVLSSNVWSLHAALLIGTALLPRLRPVLATALPVLSILVVWLLVIEARDTILPVTYETVWLPVHVWLGKLFLGTVVLAVGASVVVLMRAALGGGRFARLPATPALDDLAYRLVLLAFTFQCVMLIAGAIWAQDAWGRYWDWDPLETWSFLSWLATAAYLHARVTFRLRPAWSAATIVGIFVLAFLTFFGVPFLSTAPHQGAI